MARSMQLDSDLVNAIVETFDMICSVLEKHRITKEINSDNPAHWPLFKSCVDDADYAVKMQYGYNIRDIFTKHDVSS